MKRIFSVMLAAIMLFALVALTGCAGCDEPMPDDPAGTTPNETTPAGTPDPETPDDITFVTVNETVYATNAVNIRSSMNIDNNENVKGQLKAGDTIIRIGYHEEWSKVLFEGVECYIKSAYLSKEPPTIETPPEDGSFTAVDNETVFAYYDDDEDGKCDENAIINLRESASSSATIKHSLPRGTELVRTGILFDNGTDGAGWSRVVYNGETFYCRNSCLSTENPGPGNVDDTTGGAEVTDAADVTTTAA